MHRISKSLTKHNNVQRDYEQIKSNIYSGRTSFRKNSSKLLTDTMEVYRDIANDNVFTILENFVTCKNDYMYALTNESFSRKDRAKK